MQTILVCEDSIEGIFAGIYDGFIHRKEGKEVRLELKGTGTMRLFSEYIIIEPQAEKAEKVGRTLRRRFGESGFEILYRCALSQEEEKANALYCTIVMGFSLKKERDILDHITDDSVRLVVDSAKTVWYEWHRWLGFLRFLELEQGVLYASFYPKSNVLELLAEHFSDRMISDNWIIYEEKRKLFALHRSGDTEWVLFNGSLEYIHNESLSTMSQSEEYIQELWKNFHETIGIKERRNPRLQKQWMPLFYRKNLVENVEKGKYQ